LFDLTSSWSGFHRCCARLGAFWLFWMDEVGRLFAVWRLSVRILGRIPLLVQAVMCSSDGSGRSLRCLKVLCWFHLGADFEVGSACFVFTGSLDSLA